MSDFVQDALDSEHHEQRNTHSTVLDHRADIECGDTMIYTIENQEKLLAEACQYQMLPDSNAGKLLVL
jgi:hypothetical protein